LVALFEYMMMHRLTNPKLFRVLVSKTTLQTWTIPLTTDRVLIYCKG